MKEESPMTKNGRSCRRRLILLGLTGGAVSACAYLQHPKFGAPSGGEALPLILSSPHYRDGRFQNLIPTPVLSEDSNVVSVLLGNLTTRGERLRPESPLPVRKTDLKALDRHTDLVVWFGHSSCFVQLAGRRILVDPVFGAYAAPIPFVNRAFDGTNAYAAHDMPEIDCLLITHDHWDHLDYASVRELEPKTRRVVTPLGVGTYLEQWGYAREKIREADWFSAVDAHEDLRIHVLPARHFSGRLLVRNRTQWAGFAVETSGRRIFFSGDGGYGPHFAGIGKHLGGFDLAVLDNGQYDRRWAYIHMTPEEAVRAAVDLRAKALLPAHVGRFCLAKHPWDEPFERVVAASEGKPFRLLTPMIGEPILLDGPARLFGHWWKQVEEA
ncbi:MAG: MBL fold metallo-hydrolase [Candidatus Accumulibacter sp.]|jgi:L-ascorbate metabolism protein UlaG (beta-lactamase superfamily)|nr:MBL fold metallo-hydrolase [Accumulibacter sp.]